VLLRMLREPHTGKPSPGARLLVALVILSMAGSSVVILFPVIHWVLGLL
jgi:hypothetical protein